jgi:hypothetical protein
MSLSLSPRNESSTYNYLRVRVRFNATLLSIVCIMLEQWGRRGREHMVVGFITIYAISAYHH